ncbi:MAG: hypothetical protein AB1757_30475 [Acidobacteriota bacterium]
MFVFSLVILFFPFAGIAQQSTRLVYDDNGRLRAVILPTGEIAVYEYDPAGNFTAIRRLAPTAFEVLSFLPREGSAGDRVTIVGAGIGNGVMGVTFNGAVASIVETGTAVVIAEVPDNATSGLISLTMPAGTLTTSTPFTVLPKVRLSPATIALFPGESVAFSATVTPTLQSQNVVWSVNGIQGGNATVGTISTTGLYTAPNQPSASFMVRATSLATPSLFGEASVTVRDPNLVGSLFAPVLSVRRGLIVDQVMTAQPLAVRYGSATGSGLLQSAMVSVTTGPVILSISPNQIPGGATNFSITISGNHLNGATGMQFVNPNGANDTTITAANLVVNANGDTLTATLTVSTGATLGQRLVMVVTPDGTSLPMATSANTIQIVSQ